jgi:hypothetical protein
MGFNSGLKGLKSFRQRKISGILINIFILYEVNINYLVDDGLISIRVV